MTLNIMLMKIHLSTFLFYLKKKYDFLKIIVNLLKKINTKKVLFFNKNKIIQHLLVLQPYLNS